VASVTSWSKYFMAVTPPTMSSSTRTSLKSFGKIRVPSAYSCDPLFMLLSAWPFYLACGDEAPTYGTPLCTMACATSYLWLYGTKPVACSVYHFPCPLELSDSVLLGSSSINPASCVGFFSSSTITGFVSYSGV
jgi:hypothetical protein